MEDNNLQVDFNYHRKWGTTIIPRVTTITLQLADFSDQSGYYPCQEVCIFECSGVTKFIRKSVVMLAVF